MQSLSFVLKCMGKLIEYINKELDLREYYKMIFGRDMPIGKFLCPNPMHKHENNTPSCKAYGNVFKCFGQCNRVFGVYDLLKWYWPEKIEEIKAKIILPEATEVSAEQFITKVQVDRSKPIGEVLQQITGICLNSFR